MGEGLGVRAGAGAAGGEGAGACCTAGMPGARPVRSGPCGTRWARCPVYVPEPMPVSVGLRLGRLPPLVGVSVPLWWQWGSRGSQRLAPGAGGQRVRPARLSAAPVRGRPSPHGARWTVAGHLGPAHARTRAALGGWRGERGRARWWEDGGCWSSVLGPSAPGVPAGGLAAYGIPACGPPAYGIPVGGAAVYWVSAGGSLTYGSPRYVWASTGRGWPDVRGMLRNAELVLGPGAGPGWGSAPGPESGPRTEQVSGPAIGSASGSASASAAVSLSGQVSVQASVRPAVQASVQQRPRDGSRWIRWVRRSAASVGSRGAREAQGAAYGRRRPEAGPAVPRRQRP